MIQLPDFKLGYNNRVTAVYVVNPAILELDDQTQLGRPFLFLSDSVDVGVPARQVEDGMGKIHPYVGRRADLDELLQGREIKGSLPEAMKINGNYINGNYIPTPLLFGRFQLRGAGLYVPFSFGVFHEQDVQDWQKNGPSVRTDLDEFRLVLARYDVQQQAEEQRSREGLGLVRAFWRPSTNGESMAQRLVRAFTKNFGGQ